jgi:hypothetical protein
MHMGFSPVFFLLQQECYLTDSCLTTGLTALRNAHVGDKGRFYSAFFNLGTGLERLMKLVVVLDHMTHNQLKAPSIKEMRNTYGHDLLTLYASVGKIASTSTPTPFTPLVPSSTGYRILQLLSEFSEGTRYANLNQLSGSSIGTDPLAKWNQILLRIVETEVSKRQRAKVHMQSAQIAEVLKDSSLVIAHDLEGRAMSLENIFTEPRLQELAARSAVWHLVQLIAAIREVVVAVGDNATVVSQAKTMKVMNIPMMSEFLTFAWLNKAWVMKKKRWP